MTHVKYKTPISTLKEFELEDGTTIWQMVEEQDIPVNILPTVVAIGDDPILRKDWDKPIPYGSEVSVISIHQGGGGFKQILALVATIALAILVPFAVGFIAPLLGIGALGANLLAAGIILAGSFLINALLGPQEENTPDRKGPSPTYSIGAQGNQARLLQPIPRLYGKHVIYPDFASQPYGYYENNQQYLCQTFVLGLGTYDVARVRIDDTDIWKQATGVTNAYKGIEVEIVDNGDAISLFHTQVFTSVEVQNLDLGRWGHPSEIKYWFNPPENEIKYEGESAVFQFALPGDQVAVISGANAGTYTVSDVDPEGFYIIVEESLVSLAEEEVRVVQPSPDTWVGPYVANPANTITNKIEIDIILPRGLYYTNDENEISPMNVGFVCQIRPIDAAGDSLGDWETVARETLTRATLTPQRLTYTFDVDDGRYEVRCRRKEVQIANSKYQSTLQWGSLRAFIPHDNKYEGVTVLAVKARATGQLNQQSARRINAIMTGKVPVWNGSEWTEPQATRSIAWIAADILRNSEYSVGYPASGLDIDTFDSMNTFWNARGDHFDGIFDSLTTVWDALSQVLAAGRAYPVVVAGIMSIVRDERKDVPTAMFSPSNIVRDSFESEHILYDDDSPDDLIVQYIDNRTWKRNEVRCTLPTSLSEKPEYVTLFGITDRDHAWREGIFMAAVNAKRRLAAKFVTELEGRMLVRGDAIIVAHDLFNWGEFGQVLSYSSGTRTLTIDRSDLEITGQQQISFRARNGDVWGPVLFTQDSSDATKFIFDATDLTTVEAAQGSFSNVMAIDGDSVYTQFILCEVTTEHKQFIVVTGVPSEGELVELTCIVDDDEVYDADLGSPPPEVWIGQPAESDERVVITNLTATKTVASPNNAPIIDYAWDAAAGVTYYVLQISYDNEKWLQIYKGASNFFSSYQAIPGHQWTRVFGFTSLRGKWTTIDAIYGTDTDLPEPPRNLRASNFLNAGTLQINWDFGFRAEEYNLYLYRETTVDSGTYDIQVLSENGIEDESLLINSKTINNKNGPWRNIEIRVESVNTSGTSSQSLIQIEDITLEAPENLKNSNPVWYGENLTVVWDRVKLADSYLVELLVSSVVLDSWEAPTNTYTITEAVQTALGGPWSEVDVRVTAQAGKTDSKVTSSSTSITVDNVLVP